MATQKKFQVIGLDIGSHSIKAVEIDHARKGRILKNFGMVGLPPNAIVEGAINEMDVVSSAVRNLFSKLKIRNRNVAGSISGFSVIVKKITFDNKNKEELEKLIYEEAEQYIPFDINEVNLDFEVIGSQYESAAVGREDEGGSEKEDEDLTDDGQMEVMVVAAKKDIVEDYISLLQIAGIGLSVLDVDAFALQNAFEISTEEADPEGCFAIVNVGAEELGINAVKDGVSLFTRDSSYGGSQITQAIMSEFNLGFEKAEKIKLGGGRVGKDKKALEEIFTSVVSEWVMEIKRALDFLSTTYPDDTVKHIMLSGGSCRIPGFKKYLELETDIPVSEINPFTNLIIDERQFDPKYLAYVAPQAAVAVGLALRHIGDK